MIDEKREAGTPASEDSDPTRLYQTDAEIAAYLGGKPLVIPVLIHVKGEPGAPEIHVTPGAAEARQNQDAVIWWPGANCGEWQVEFKNASPLSPEGAYSSSGPIGGMGVGEPGFYPYTVRAVDRRTGEWVELDPDVVMIPGKSR